MRRYGTGAFVLIYICGKKERYKVGLPMGEVLFAVLGQ